MCLARGTPVGAAITVVMTWRLHLAGPVDDRVSHSGDGIRLGSFFPVLSWEPGVGWARDPKVALAPGDTVEVEVEGIGVLANPVVAG